MPMPDTAHHALPATPAADDADRRRARALPKVLLHEHLDGGLRVATLLDLARQRDVPVPAEDEEALGAWFDARAHAGSLEEYLRGFALTVAAMATPQGLARVAFEAAEDARAEGCVLAEFRIAPLLFEAHGVTGDAAVAAMLDGLARSPLPSGLIVCGMRHEDDARIAQAADLALRWAGRGVVGFDLAGPEAGFPASRHAALLARVRDDGLGLTLHAGEADAGHRVLEAARLGAQRIGHGVRLADLVDGPDSPALLAELKARSVHLEVCPTSNLHTGAAATLAAHPIHALWRAGVSLSFHTDNRLISRIDHSTEALNLAQHGFAWAELLQMGLDAAAASFLPAAARTAATAQLRDWGRQQGLALPPG
jgi:adenosine deaminase